MGSGPAWKYDPRRLGPESCPNTGSIACLLLETVGSEEGPTGGKLLSKTTFVQRLNTKGGSAPLTVASFPRTWGTSARPYTADYFFFRKAK